MLIREAKKIAGTLGKPSKMPGTAYALPAQACILGAKLAKVPGTVCSKCYALPASRTGYRYPNAVKGMYKRLEAIRHPRWVDAMVTLLLSAHSRPIFVDLGAVGVRLQKMGGSRYRYNEPGWHRWHDSGDLQGVWHLRKIVEVCRRTPAIRHWLPTNELWVVEKFLEDGDIPPNLTIRVSSVKIDAHHRRNFPTTSSVFTQGAPPGARVCPAPEQDHKCGSCRACWSREVPHVAYRFHQ